MKSLSLFTLLFAAATLDFLVLGQTTSPEIRAKTPLLDRRAQVNVGSATTTGAAFKSTLNATRVPGGIVTVLDCITPVKHPLRLNGSSLQDTLNAITTADPQYKWGVDEGVVNLLPHNSNPCDSQS